MIKHPESKSVVWWFSLSRRKIQFVQNGEDNDYYCYCGKKASSSEIGRFGSGRSEHYWYFYKESETFGGGGEIHD